MCIRDRFTGADENEVDYYNLVYGRDFKVDGVVEAVEVRHGDMSPDGSGPLSFERGVEIGQVFQLGLEYSKVLDLKVLDQNGKAVPVWMGCYGIGVSRVLACIAETHHDEAGTALPFWSSTFRSSALEYLRPSWNTRCV